MTRPSAWRAFWRALGDPFRMPWPVWLAAVPLFVSTYIALYFAVSLDVAWLFGDTVSSTSALLAYILLWPAVEVVSIALLGLFAISAMLRLLADGPDGPTPDAARKTRRIAVVVTGGMGLVLYLIADYGLLALTEFRSGQPIGVTLSARFALDCAVIGFWAAALSAAREEKIVNPFSGIRLVLRRPIVLVSFAVLIMVHDTLLGASFWNREIFMAAGWPVPQLAVALSGAASVFGVLVCAAFVARLFADDPLADGTPEIFE